MASLFRRYDDENRKSKISTIPRISPTRDSKGINSPLTVAAGSPVAEVQSDQTDRPVGSMGGNKSRYSSGVQNPSSPKPGATTEGGGNKDNNKGGEDKKKEGITNQSLGSFLTNIGEMIGQWTSSEGVRNISGGYVDKLGWRMKDPNRWA